jgi:hypothetical protein
MKKRELPKMMFFLCNFKKREKKEGWKGEKHNNNIFLQQKNKTHTNTLVLNTWAKKKVVGRGATETKKFWTSVEKKQSIDRLYWRPCKMSKKEVFKLAKKSSNIKNREKRKKESKLSKRNEMNDAML